MNNEEMKVAKEIHARNLARGNGYGRVKAQKEKSEVERPAPMSPVQVMDSTVHNVWVMAQKVKEAYTVLQTVGTVADCNGNAYEESNRAFLKTVDELTISMNDLNDLIES